MAKKKKNNKGNPMMGTLGRGSEERRNVNMVVYGRSGAGKTYFAAHSPKPYMLAFDPRGHDSVPFEIPGRVVHTLDEVADVIEWFENGEHLEYGIRTLIADGMNFAYDMVVRDVGSEIVDQKRAPSIDRLPYGGGMEIQNPYKRLLTRLVNLTTIEPEEYRVNVILTTLDEHVKESEEAPFNIRPQFGTKAMNQNFPALFSVIGYIVPVGEDEEGNISTERRMLLTEYRGILARDRLGIFPLMGPAPKLSDYLT